MDIYSKFGIDRNRSYDWIVKEGLIGNKTMSPISPWYHVSWDEMKRLPDVFSQALEKNLILFARRQDCDAMAFLKITDNQISGVCLIQGWTREGFKIVQEYSTLWDWLKSVIDDIADLAD